MEIRIKFPDDTVLQGAPGELISHSLPAGAYTTDFFDDLDDLDEINWHAVEATDFRPMIVKEGKQAEFLVYESFPWKLIERLGVIDGRMEQRVGEVLRDAIHKPLLAVEQGWYY